MEASSRRSDREGRQTSPGPPRPGRSARTAPCQTGTLPADSSPADCLVCISAAIASSRFKMGLDWTMKRNMRSPRYTTHYDELPLVKAA
ncbi:DUF4113 domain-containing protein [Arthrobacter sp. ZGTC131]|uniref:DUF4113 domain-containing protein n=1 Tax=Arthrobacter sp. ZGTC131 TaxID=2058898 RepID=UPI0021575D98|nr:DUF4113 domain-containing protein [Arthrobacter sp. ZGTC131]